jgi:hypothetical protein
MSLQKMTAESFKEYKRKFSTVPRCANEWCNAFVTLSMEYSLLPSGAILRKSCAEKNIAIDPDFTPRRTEAQDSGKKKRLWGEKKRLLE